MNEKIEQQVELIDKSSYNLDFEYLYNYRIKEAEDLPIYGMMALYKAIGLTKEVKEYGKSICCADNFWVNFNTLQKIQNLIKDNWEQFNITIEEDNGVRWKENEPRARRKRGKKLSAKINASVMFDFYNYSPNIDDELGDNILVFRIIEPKKDPNIIDIGEC